MIRSFADRRTAALAGGNYVRGLPTDIQERARRKLRLIDEASSTRDLEQPPGNRLEALAGDRRGQWSIRVNIQWRICFRWSDDGAEDVELADYH